MDLVTGAQMREIDRRTIDERGIPGGVLMARAGQGVALSLVRRIPDLHRRRTWIVCGGGNNGGDGLVLAALLRERGLWPRVLLAPTDPPRGDAASALERARRAEVDLELGPSVERLSSVRPDDVVVDALLGTGLTGPARGLYRDWILALRALRAQIVAVDLPSGAWADPPEDPAVWEDAAIVRATWTVTFGAPKVSLLFPPVRTLAGPIDVVDLGFPADVVAGVGRAAQLSEPSHVAALLPRREAATHKGDWGKVLVVGGFPGTAGAVALAARAAIRMGAGLTRAAVPASLASEITAHTPEAMTLPLPEGEEGQLLAAPAAERILGGFGDWDALAVGPGLGRLPEPERLVLRLVGAWAHPMVIDADGLNALARWGADAWVPRARRTRAGGEAGGMVVTPHLGELSRLTGGRAAELARDPIETARTWSARWGATLVMKGAPTVIAAPDGRVWVNPTGNSGLSKGGSGDVLTGIVLALLGQGLTGPDAAVLACYLHGLAADLAVRDPLRARRSLLPSEVIEALPHALAAVASGEGPPHWIWRRLA